MLNEQPRRATQSQFNAMNLSETARKNLLKTAWGNGGYVPMPFSPGAGSSGAWKRAQIQCAETIIVPIEMIERSLSIKV